MQIYAKRVIGDIVYIDFDTECNVVMEVSELGFQLSLKHRSRCFKHRLTNKTCFNLK